ncbi:hypothetical protein [Frigidibacter sp. MR17.24]|uniref:hypothetical protein n=1 Tax=Frigidibacter sp. MR17.24 TaxID=3127345 RepID=UPI0030130DE4
MPLDIGVLATASLLALTAPCDAQSSQTTTTGDNDFRNSNNNLVQTFNIIVGPQLSDKPAATTMLSSQQDLIRALLGSGDLKLSEEGAADLSRGLATIAENTPFANFMILEDQFTLRTGVTHILRDNSTTIGLRGFHSTGPMLFLNGQDVRPATGATIEFPFLGKPCRLVNNTSSPKQDEASFTVIC